MRQRSSSPQGFVIGFQVSPWSAERYSFDSGPYTRDLVEFLNLFHPDAIIIPVEESYAMSLTPAESEGSKT